MDKADIHRYDEDEKEVGQTVQPEGKLLIIEECHQGDIKVNQGAQETHAGEIDVGGFFLTPEQGEESERREYQETGYGEEKIGI
jgi:hypothetical protein